MGRSSKEKGEHIVILMGKKSIEKKTTNKIYSFFSLRKEILTQCRDTSVSVL